MAKLIWTEPALENVEEITDYISLSNPLAAKQLVRSIFDVVARLESFPESGRIPDELSEFSYREVVVNPCRAFYKIEGNSIFILYVLRQERDVRRYILGFDKD